MKHALIALSILYLVTSVLVAAAHAEPLGADLVMSRCGTCHAVSRICNELGESQEEFLGLTKGMVKRGAKLNREEQEIVASYLAGLTRETAPFCVMTTPAVNASTAAETPGLPLPIKLGHPALMALTLVLLIYVFYLGLVRFRFSHLKHKVVFPWKKHVQYGYIVLILMLAGTAGGMVVVWMNTGGVGATGWHFSNALLMLPVILFSFITGRGMDRNKAPRTLLPVLHGVSGLLLLLMALCQTSTGIGLVQWLLSQ